MSTIDIEGINKDFEEHFKKTFSPDSLSHHYHYTSFESGESILKGRALHLSDLNSTNDPSEFLLGLNILRSAINLSKYNKILDDYSDVFDDTPYPSLRENIAKSHEALNSAIIFSISFSNPINFALWREYADDGKGLAINVNRENLQSFLKCQPFPHNIVFMRPTLIKVLYLGHEEAEDAQKIFDAIQGYVDYQLKILEKCSKLSKLDKKLVAVRFIYWLICTSPCIKHAAYAYEKETRLLAICHRNILKAEYKFSNKNKNSLIYYDRKKQKFKFVLPITEDCFGESKAGPMIPALMIEEWKMHFSKELPEKFKCLPTAIPYNNNLQIFLDNYGYLEYLKTTASNNT